MLFLIIEESKGPDNNSGTAEIISILIRNIYLKLNLSVLLSAVNISIVTGS